MPIEISCSNCQAILRVADEHAGKSARCPQCSTVIPIPLTPLEDAPPAGSTWQDQPTQYAAGAAAAHSAASANPYASPHKAGLPRGMEAHRGPVILILGILSLVCCVFIAIPAIIMANEDVRKMDNGTMNPDGRSLTTAGKIIGIVSLVINAAAIVLQVLVMFFGALAQPGF